jgi:hypothetical protein
MKADLMGRRFGRLTVIGEAETATGGNSRWVCRCDCGNESVVLACNLKSGHTTSCGCYSEERHSIVQSNGGVWPERLYHIWYYMLSRCNDSSSKDYPNYGGRGIAVCKEWESDFYVFAKWALSNGYQDTLTIDRRNNEGSYCPENCRWATVKEQSNNKRNNRILEHNGKKMTVSQWAREIGCKPYVVFSRLRCGWPVDRALSAPIQRRA